MRPSQMTKTHELNNEFMDPTVTDLKPHHQSGPRRPRGLLIPNSSAQLNGQVQNGAHAATSGRTGPNSHRRRHPRASPLPTSNHIIWEEAGLLPPSSVGVRPRTPTMRRGGDAQAKRNNGDVQIQNREDTYTEDWWQIIELLRRKRRRNFKRKEKFAHIC